jgi:hypothetical protein
MNMEFSQTSGSRPELARGTGIILKYDGETANGQAISLAREFLRVVAATSEFPSPWIESWSKQLILDELRHDWYGSAGSISPDQAPKIN